MPTGPVESVLRKTHRLHRFVRTLAAAGLGFSALLAAVFLAVILDAAVGFPAPVLIAIDVALVFIAVAAVSYAVWRWASGRYHPQRIARIIEEGLGYRDSRLINAVQFAGNIAYSTSPALSTAAIAAAEARADGATTSSAIDRRVLRISIRFTCLALCVFVLTALAAPRMFAMVVPRYLNPTGDLPPFTLLDFAVATEPDRIYFGKPASIRVGIRGPFAPDTARVVFVDSAQRDTVTMHKQEMSLFVLPLDRVETSRRFYIDTPHGRSHVQTLTVLPVPLFESVTVRYDYPAYTGWPSVERPLDAGGLHALAGTRATLTIRSNLPLRNCEVRLPGSSGGPVTDYAQPHDDPRTCSTTLALTSDGAYELQLFAADGTPGDQTLTGPITVTADRPPTVQLMAPDLRSVAPEGWKVPIRVAASDDIGLSRVTLHHRVNDAPSVPFSLEVTHHRDTYATASATLDLDAIGAKAGDTIRGFATAFDNHPDPSNAADSPTFEVKVLTEDEYKEMARNQYAIEDLIAEIDAFNAERDRLDAEREKLIEQLKATKENPDTTRAEEIRQALENHAEQTRALADAMRHRADQMPIYTFEPAAQKQLAEAAKQMQARAASASTAASAATSDPDSAIEELKKGRADQSESPEKQLTEEQLRKLALADRLMGEADIIMSIAQAQRQLADRLSPFQGTSSPPSNDDAARLRQLGYEQEQLNRDLSEALDMMHSAAADAVMDLPKMSGSANDLVRKIREELMIEEDMADAAVHALASRGDASHTEADEAADKLESLISECKGVGNCASDDLDRILSLTRSQLAAALSELAGARAGRGMGSGSGAGSRGGTGTGASGSQTGGAPSRYSLLGPHSRTNLGRTTARLNAKTGTYNTLNDGFDPAANAEAAERLESEDATTLRRSGGGLPGVPLQYKTLAEQYFKRLAEDSR